MQKAFTIRFLVLVALWLGFSTAAMASLSWYDAAGALAAGVGTPSATHEEAEKFRETMRAVVAEYDKIGAGELAQQCIDASHIVQIAENPSGWREILFLLAGLVSLIAALFITKILASMFKVEIAQLLWIPIAGCIALLVGLFVAIRAAKRRGIQPGGAVGELGPRHRDAAGRGRFRPCRPFPGDGAARQRSGFDGRSAVGARGRSALRRNSRIRLAFHFNFDGGDGKAGQLMIRKRMANGAATALLCVAFLVVGGCGDGARENELDVAALNAALALQEGELLEGLSALKPDKVNAALDVMRTKLAAAERMLQTLPQDDPANTVTLATTLAHFRADVSSLMTVVEESAKAETAAVRTAHLDVESLRALHATLADDEWSSFLNGFSETLRETERLLGGWRKQRLEKAESGLFATFPAFHAAAEEHYVAWETWTATASAMQRRILEEFFPMAQSTASNLTIQTATAMRESERLADAIARLRAIPLDDGLVETARTKALASFNDIVLPEIKALSEWREDEKRFPDEARRSANALDNRWQTFWNDADDFQLAHRAFVSEQAKSAVQTAIESARSVASAAREAADSFAQAFSEYRGEYDALSGDAAAARQAAENLRSAKNLQEEELAANITAIESLRNKFETPPRISAFERRRSLDELRDRSRKSLQEAESSLISAEKHFAEEKSKAIAKEKTAKWETEKKVLKTELTQVKASLEREPAPGYVRPKDDVLLLKKTVENLLSRIDSIREDELRNSVAKAKADAKGIEAKTKWAPGSRHPTLPHVFATEKENTWNADPGYWFDHPGENSDLVVSWRPGQRHPDHAHVSAGQQEGSWVPDPGYKARWNGDLDPVWTPGARHPRWPHVQAGKTERKWDRDPGYDWTSTTEDDLSVRWKSGLRHPHYEGIESAQQEGRWNALPGWAFVNPGSSDLRTRWVQGARHPANPHIHASAEKWKWFADDGYDFDVYNSSNLSVHWKPGLRHSTAKGVVSAPREGYWQIADGWRFLSSGPSERPGTADLRAQWMRGTRKQGWPHVHAGDEENKWSTDDGYTWMYPNRNDDFSVRWTPGWLSPDGQRRAKQQEGRFETKRDCPSCDNGYKVKSQKCGTCNGSGTFFFTDCPRCDGTGRVQLKNKCNLCNGVGWRWR